MKTTLTLCSLLFAMNVAWAESTPVGPYAGQEKRAIKSLSQQEVDALLAGHGASFAKAAELNGYPGPAHVMELARQLRLDQAQQEASGALMAAHKTRAQELGRALVASEKELDRLFAHKSADVEAVDRATQRVGLLQGQLRAEHLKMHLAQTALLTAEQIGLYAVLRGYAVADPSTPAAAHDGKHVHH